VTPKLNPRFAALANVEAILSRVLKLVAPPEREPLSAWADAHRVLSAEASASVGDWRSLPFQREPLDAVAPGSEYRTVVLVWASQLGKSEVLMNFITYVIAIEPGPLLVVQPTLSMAESFSKDRLSPLFRDTPILKGKVAEPKSRDLGSTIYHRRFHGGHLTLVGSNSPSGLAARPIRYLLLDEVDRYEESAGAEGDPVTLARARTRTFWNRKIILTSSPTVRGASRIETAWRESDQREYEVPCPLCGHFQQLKWDRVEWPDGEPEHAAYRCAACAELIPHHLKDGMVERGRWSAANPSSRIAGFHLSELVSPWRSWGDLAAEWLHVKDNPEQLRAFENTSLAEWTSDDVVEPPRAEALAARCEPFAAEVPMGASLLTCGVDIQHDRAEAELVGWGRGFESWSLGYYTLHGDPSGPHLWQQLDALLSREFRHESGMPLRISAAAIDCGYLPDEILAFTKDKFSRRVYGVKGLNSGWGKPVWPRKAIYNRRQLPLFLISVDEAKQWFHRRLALTEGPGCCHFPLGRPLDYFRMLTAETLVRRHRNGRVIFEWANLRRERNEALDARVYSIAALHSLLMAGLNVDVHSESFQKMLAPPPDAVSKPNGAPAVSRSKWMDY
jgi:phage terminase large subunit GpA-like protein